MEWEKSYSTSWRVFHVNRKTWADGEQVYGVDSVSITRTTEGTLLESGSIEVTGDMPNDYYRIVMTAEQSGEVVRVDVGTLLFNVSGGIVDYGTTIHTAEGHSVLYPASVTTIIAGEYAPAGVDGAAYAGRLLNDSINAPVVVEGSFVLNDHIVHEIGSSVLDAVWSVLNAGNFVIQIDGRGVVHIRPKPTEPSLILDNSNTRLLTNGINYSTNESDIPNRYIVIIDSYKTVVVNNDPDSSVSLANRGYYVDKVDESPEPVDGETLNAYALRKLKEASIMLDDRTYEREYAQDVYPYSIVKASIDGLEGNLRVQSQNVKCDYGVTINERATKEVPLW